MLQGEKKCWNARLVKLTKDIYPLRITPDALTNKPILRFSLKSISEGEKKAPENDVSFENEKGIIFTNFDSVSLKILNIKKQKQRLIVADFSFSLRNTKGDYLHFTQGEVKLNF